MEIGRTGLNTGDDVGVNGGLASDPAALAELIVRSATDFAIVTSDRDGVITSWSPGAEKILGWTQGQAVGRDVDLFFTPEDATTGVSRAELARAADAGCATDERWHMKADGSRFWASGELQPLRAGGAEGGGEIVGFVKILRDRTEHHELVTRLEAAQAEAIAANVRAQSEEERLRAVFEAAPGFITILRGPAHVFELVNASYLQLVGHRALIGLPVREGLPELEGQGFIEMLDGVYATGERVNVSQVPVLLQREPGGQLERRFISFVYEAMRDSDGAVTGIFVEGFDVTDAVTARAAADKVAAEQAAILGQLGEGVIATDADGRITFVNAAAERLHGVARLDVAPDDYSDTYHLLTEDGAPYPPAELPLARAVARGETVADARWRIRRPDGSEVLAIGNARPVVVDGARTGAVLTVRDDTARAETEAALRASEGQFQAIADSVDPMIWSTRLDGFHDYFNARWYEYTGTPPGSTDGEGWADMFHPDDQDRTWAAWNRSLSTGEPYHIEYRLRHRSGEYRWVIGRALPVRDGDGAITRWYGTCTDVHDFKQAEAALRASETRARDVLEGMAEGFLTTDRDLTILSINAEGLRIDGRGRDEIVGRPILEVWPETASLPNWALFEQVLADDKPGSIEYRHRSDAHDVWLETRAYPIAGGLAIFYRDVTARRQAEERVRETEERYRLAARATNDAIWDWDLVSNTILWNEAVYTAFGYAQDEVDTSGDWWIDHIHPDDRTRVADGIHAVIDGDGTSWTDEYRFLRGDGGHADVFDRGTVIRDAHGRAVRMIGAMQDLTRRKADQAALRASDERYRTLFDAIDAGFCVIELLFDGGRAVDYRFLELNAAFEAQSGLSNAVGKTIRDFAPDTSQIWIDFYADVAGSREPRRKEDFFPELDRWFDVYAYSVDAPELNRVAVLFNDISERKKAELRLTELNRTLETRVAETVAERDMIWRTSQDLFAVIDGEAKYVSVNPAWTEALGFSTDELVGMSSLELVHPDDVERCVAEFARVAQGTVVRSIDLRTRRKDGGYRVFSWTAVPHKGVLYASGRDVTERRELEEQLRQSQKMEAVGQLTGGIAHDFNNLLTIVSGNIDMAKRSLGPDGDARALRSLGNAAKGADRAAALTQRLLAFSRRQPLQPRATDVNRLVTGMTELLDRALGETVELQVVAGAGLWRVEVDPNQLENAILNLAVNARDAMPMGGKLTVETTNSAIDEAYAASHNEVAPGQYVLISVTDTGEGMPPEVVAKAFDPFFSTKEVGKGTGLGLSQVYGYVKQSGGHVSIYSEPGHGTTIKLYLPRLVAEMNAGEEEAAEAAPALKGQETILVVEDDDDVRIYTVDSLRELGYRVLEAHDGASALRLLEKQDEPVKLLLTDVVMPGMSGRELADQAREAWPEMQVLFTTGYARNAIVHGGRLDPGVELLPKPFTFDALAAKVRAVLEKVGVERALVLDPSADARDIAVAMLGRMGLDGEPAATVREALGKLRAGGGMFDLVTLSDALPVGNLDAVIAELHAVRAALPILILSTHAADALNARYADRPCVAAMALPLEEETLRERLETLKVRCARTE